METFHWNRSFETGLDAVDDQHHRLVDLINAFSELLAEDEIENKTIQQLLGELADYAVYHFTEEEAMMREAGIDHRHLAAHRREHRDFVEDVAGRRESLIGVDRAQAESLLRFLIYWLIYHILGSDQSMARQIAQIRGGASPSDAYDEEQQGESGPTAALVSALHGLFHIVSDRNRELRELTRTLEEKVEARTRELAETNRVLEAMAMTDALTGLPNRRQAMKRLDLLWSDFLGNEKPLSCLMIDADGFKEINDSHGHDAGDLVLTHLARALQGAVRTDDVVARLGGDEFFVILPKTDHAGAMRIAEKLRRSVSSLRVDVGVGAWTGSISIGVATSDPAIGQAGELVKAADRNLYAAKQAGRNCVRGAEPD